MAIKIGQEFERTSKATRFKDDVMTKAQMLACTDDNYSDGYLVVEKDSHDLYIYDSNATPSQETGKFVKSSGTSGSDDYSDLTNKPKINNIELNGNKKAEDLEIKTFGRYENEDVYGIHTYTDFFGFKSDKSIQGYGSWGFAYDSSVKDVVMINSEYEPADNHQIQRRLPTREAVNTLLANKQDTLQVTTLPTASATEEGNIYQYVGATDSNYTNGYFYQCQEITPATDPKTYEWVQKDVQSSELPAGGTTGQILAKKTDENGDVEWIEDIGRSLTQFDRKYGIIPANVPITVRVAEFVRETYTYTEYRVPYGGIITSPSSISSGILNTFDAYVVVSGYSESKVKEYVSATNSYRLENSLLVKLDPITQSGNYAGIQAKETSNDRKVTSIRLVARGDNNFGMGDGTAPYDIRNLTGMVLDDLRVTGTAIPTDWGIATKGFIQILNNGGEYGRSTVDVSGFGFENADDYSVSLVIVSGAGGYGGVNTYIPIKTTTEFAIHWARVSGGSATRVDFEYTIFAKGYGNNRMQSGGGSLPTGGTTGQALVKKSDTDGDVERRTVQGLSNIVDMSFTQRSEEGETWTDSVTIKKGNSNNSYLEIKQNTENGNLLDVYITDNTVDVPHTLVSKYYADYNAGKIATIKVNGTEQTVTNRTVDIKTPEFNVNVNGGEVNEATIVNKANGQVKEIISFSKSLVDENCIQFHTETDNISDTPLDTHLTSKTYVDSKSPTIVNEGATFTNAQGNQKMQIRTGGINSVIIKDINGTGTTEYWSYELPDKPYVDTELAKKGNTNTIFDNEYKTLQIRDVNDSVELQVVKETSNDYIRVNEYAEDDRGQMQQIFDVNLPTKTYVDNEILSQEKTSGNYYYRTSRDPMGYKLLKKNQTSNADTALSLNSNEIALTHSSGSGASVEDLRINTQENGTCSVQMSDNMISAFNSTLGAGVTMEVGAEKWYGTYTEDGVTYQVYSKIVYIPALPSTAGITTYPMGVSNIKQILNIYGYTTDGFILNAPRQNAQDNISIYQVSKGSQTFSIEVGKDRSSKKAYVTIIYAKNN